VDPDALQTALLFLHLTGMLGFGGGIVVFYSGFVIADRMLSPEEKTGFDRTFRSVSLGMSVCLALLIFSGLGLRFHLHSLAAYAVMPMEGLPIGQLLRARLSWGPPLVGGLPQPWRLTDQLDLLRTLLFVVQWLAWGWLEVVIQHPFRQALSLTDPYQQPYFVDVRRRVRRALGVQNLFLFAGLLSTLLQEATR